MRARFLLFLLLFAIVEYRLIKDHYEPQLLETTTKLKKLDSIVDRQEKSIMQLINISRAQHKIIHDYEIIIKKYQQELYYRDTLNKRALYDPN